MRSWLAIGSLGLVVGSWPLWTPQQLFPRVPLLAFPLNWSYHTDQIITWICLVLWGLVTAVLVYPKLPASVSRVAAILYAVLFGLLVVLDQHRLQPWGVHIAVCFLIATAFTGRQLLSWFIAFTASIYIYSALSKFDAQFLHTVGQDFLATLLRIWPGGYEGLQEKSRFFLATLFPIGELLCGLGLLFSRSRKPALGLAIGMHATLIAILGPWGLAHSWGVLLWNIVFIGLNLIAWRQLNRDAVDGQFRFAWFTPKTCLISKDRLGAQSSAQTDALRSLAPEVRATEKRATERAMEVVVAVICTAAMVLPLGERFGVTDHWLGWALYAPHSSRARVELLVGNVELQAKEVRPYVMSDSTGVGPWENVALERWSLSELGVPIYPQQRFYVGVARALAESTDEYGIQVTLLGTADRWTGERKRRVLGSRSELDRMGASYWFNTKPRW